MTRPKTRDERLNELVAIVMGVRFGMPGYDQRLVEMCSGFPAGSGGSGSKGTVGRPVEAQVIANVDEHRRDPAQDALSDFDRKLEATLREAERLWDEYKRVAQPRMGVSKVVDPGCELCAKVPEHYCATSYTIDIEEPAKNKRAKATVHKMRLCSWCYQFQRPDRAGRLPNEGEVHAHAEGRRVRWKVGA